MAAILCTDKKKEAIGHMFPHWVPSRHLTLSLSPGFTLDILVIVLG